MKKIPRLFSALHQPYPYYNRQQKIFKNSVTVLLLVFLFLFFFRPFNVNETEHKYNYAIICIIHAANAAFIYALFFLVLNTLTAGWVKDENWKVYKAMLSLAILMFLIGLGSFLLRNLIYTNPDNFSRKYFFTETINTFLVGSLIFGAFTLVDFYRLLKNNQTNARNFQKEITEHKSPAREDVVIKILAENDLFTFNTSELLFVKAEGNYVEFHYNNNNTITKSLKRISLKNVEEQISSQSETVIRVHRAYLVNVLHIIKIDGNAQGYQLFFGGTNLFVPVSRSYIHSFKAVMKNITL